jgi:DNA-binding response OmpR family regulator
MGGERLRVLAVEDEALIAFELEDMLVELGHEVLGPAANVAAALRLLEGSAPDVAIVDANLGGTSALPIIEALKAADVPFALASGYATSEMEGFGPEDVLIRKPYSNADLDEALRTVRDRARTKRSG